MTHILWVDIETTGLDPSDGRILEVCAVLTTGDLEVIDMRSHVISFNDELVRLSVDPFVEKMHTENGLWRECALSTCTIKQSDELICEMTKEFSPDRGATLLGGSTINFDRSWMGIYMPATFAHLSYRNLDVSSITRAVELWCPKMMNPIASNGTHRAHADIMDSIALMRFYRNTIFTPRSNHG